MREIGVLSNNSILFCFERIRALNKLILIIFLAFIAGILFTIFLYSIIHKIKFDYILRVMKNKTKRFIKHIVSLTGVFLSLIAISIIFKLLKYDSQMFPNIISVGLSVLIIDFLLKEREQAEREKVVIIIDSKLEQIMRRINAIVLKFVNLEDIINISVDEEIIKKLIEQKDILHDQIEHSYITEQGDVEIAQISLVDFTYFIAREIEADINDLISNFSQYLTSNQILLLIKIREILSQKIFKIRCSKLYDIETITEAEYGIIKGYLLQALLGLNKIIESERICNGN